MKIKLALLAAGLAGSLAAMPAAAQDATGVAPFNGLRVEGLLGYDVSKAPYQGDAANSGGIVYGIAAGYDVRRANLVFGGEAELTGASTDTRADDLNAPGDRLVNDAGRDLYVGGRIGYVVTPRVMGYAKAGYTNARFDQDYTGSATVPAFSRGVNNGGFRIGGGAEVQASANTYFKAEYRYSDYGSEAVDHRHQVLAGFGLRF